MYAYIYIYDYVCIQCIHIYPYPLLSQLCAGCNLTTECTQEHVHATWSLEPALNSVHATHCMCTLHTPVWQSRQNDCRACSERQWEACPRVPSTGPCWWLGPDGYATSPCTASPSYSPANSGLGVRGLRCCFAVLFAKRVHMCMQVYLCTCIQKHIFMGCGADIACACTYLHSQDMHACAHAYEDTRIWICSRSPHANSFEIGTAVITHAWHVQCDVSTP